MKNKKVRRMLAVMMVATMTVSMSASTVLATEPVAETQETVSDTDASASDETTDASDETAGTEDTTETEDAATDSTDATTDSSATEDTNADAAGDQSQAPSDQEQAAGGDQSQTPSEGQGSAAMPNTGGFGGDNSSSSLDVETGVGADGLTYYTGVLGSWTSGGTDESTTGGHDYKFVAGLFVNAGDTSLSNASLIKDGTYDSKSADGIVIDDSTSGHNGIIIVDTDYEITNANITLNTDADGSDTCDFSGKGSAIAVYGDSDVTITGSYVETTGVATMPIFADSGSTVTVKSSTLISNGGTLYGDYMNSPDQATMVAPPWILGIMGTSRTTNLMGNDSTMNVVDSTTSAGAWAVLSTDSGSNMYLNIYNTSLTLNNADESAAAPLSEATTSTGGESQLGETLDNPYTTTAGSGYGTYAIGNAVETFAGATLNVGTYGTIFTGGTATYTSIEAGQTYTLKSATGETDKTYEASESKNTVINSDTFGFMVHQSANTITIEKGTEVNSGYATFLVKSGSSNASVTATVDDATINNGGVLIQVMDNDDATTGGMMGADDAENLNGGNMNFKQVHEEAAGFNTAAATNDGSVQDFTFTNGEYSGNIYNASGSDGSQYGPLNGTTVNVTIGEGATLKGAAASTAAIHVTYDGSQIVKGQGGYAYDSVEDAADVLAEQNTSFDISHYYDIGQVANLVNYNGGNDVNISLTDDAVWYVTGTSVISSLSIADDAMVVVNPGASLTVGDTEYSQGCVITKDGVTLKCYNGILGSWSQGGQTVADNDYAYYAALFVDGEDYTTYSNLDWISAGTYDENSAVGIEIIDSESGHNGIILVDVGEYTISGANIVMKTDADGSDTCDFSGKGSAIAVYGNSVVTVEDSYIETAGVATMPIFADSGSTITVDNSTLISRGGTLYGDYMNSPDQAKMVAPPWILGIMGTSRTTNMMGNDTTTNVIDSETSSGAWAVLSTDSGSNMYLNIYNTSLTLMNADEAASTPLSETTNTINGGASELYATVDNPYTTTAGSGYGTYAIGNAVEVFAGATLNVGTYGTIFTGGTATYTNIEEGTTYTLKSATGENDIDYTAEESKVTTINSDTFGFMVHQSANYITIEKGTVVNSGYATFLVKSGSSGESVDATIDDSELNNGGVLIQVMDNDDATTGGMMDVDDPANLNGAGMNFKSIHEEAAGFNTAAAENDGSVQNFTFTNGVYDGNIYNASGSDNSAYGPLGGTTLNVTVGEGATLTGAAASTAAIHVTYDGSEVVKAQGGYAYDSEEDAAEILAYQNTSFDITHYFDIGQVANLVNYNGGNDINMTLTDDAVWTVTGTSVVSTLSVSDDAQVLIPSDVTLTVGGNTYTGGIITAEGFKTASVDTPSDDNTETPSTTDDGTNKSTTSKVKTGDAAQAALWLAVAVAGVAGSVVVRKRRTTK